MKDKAQERVKKAYKKFFGINPADIQQIDGGGSDREYFRLYDESGKTVVGAFCGNLKEARTFIELSRLFRREGLNVAEIYDVADRGEVYIEEDLGDVTLFSLLQTDQRLPMSIKSMATLAKLQALPEREWKDLVFEHPFSRRLIFRDLNYFKYCFLKPASLGDSDISGCIYEPISINEDSLDDEFDLLCRALLDEAFSPSGLIYRDFQSRNIMIKNEEPWLIDYQGARKGPVLYDFVSFAWQAKAKFSLHERQLLFERYLELLGEYFEFDPARLKEGLPYFALFRTLQVLGAYGFRGLIQKKTHFIESILPALDNLEELLSNGLDRDFPELNRLAVLLKRSFEGKKTDDENCRGTDYSGSALVVTIHSFSYKKGGYPEGLEGHGGGFMFDCRALRNPGRYDEYKELTGKDREVIEFLDQCGEIIPFVEKAFALVAPAIDRYIERGFDSLQVGFGCTGGRHRSVRSAELFADKVRKRYPGLKVKVRHEANPYLNEI